MVEKPFTKDPDAVLDYAFDWNTNWLQGGEIITSYEITVETGLVKDNDSEADGVVTIWLSGGTAGASYIVSCRITTDLGRTDERSIEINCNER